jgi:hypothetical protein
MLRDVMRPLKLSPRRVLAILIIAMAGGLVAALLWERGELAGSDAFAYWTAVHRWLGGQDIYQVTPGLDLSPAQGALPFAYAPWSLYLFLPWAMLPWALAWTVWRLIMIVLFAVTVIWAYERRPLATALLFAVVSPALAAEDMFHDTCLTPSTAPTMRMLADLAPRTLALMHGPSFTGDCAAALRDLADGYAERLALAGAAAEV